MKNDFDERIKNIEQELLALKTSSLYTSIRTTVATASGSVRTGTYRINYNNNGESIISSVYSNKYKQRYGGIYPHTPQGSSQLVDINTTYPDPDTGDPVTYDISFVVVSNVPVTSIVRI